MEAISNAYRILLWFSIACLSISSCACLVRAVIGPRFTDRIVATNVISSKVVILTAIVSCLLVSPSLLDIALVYAMIGFLTIVVLAKCYLLPHHNNPADPTVDYNDSKEAQE